MRVQNMKPTRATWDEPETTKFDCFRDFVEHNDLDSIAEAVGQIIKFSKKPDSVIFAESIANDIIREFEECNGWENTNIEPKDFATWFA